MNIDLTAAYAQASSPRVDGRSFSTQRRTPGNYRIVGSGYGGAPDVKLYRDFSGKTSGGALVLSPGAGDVGTLVKPSVNACVHMNDVDGFGAIAARAGVSSSLTALYFDYAATEQFRIFSSEKTPNGWAFAGQINRETAPPGSVLKSSWPSLDDGQGGKADLCTPTFVGSLVSVSGNTSQPGGVLSPLVNFADWWNWQDWNDFSFYQVAGSPDPIANNGYQECMISSAVTGATKTTGTKLVSQSVPVHGTGTDIEAGQTAFNRTYIWSYFTDAHVSFDGLPRTYKSNMLRRATYWATGPNSYQCIVLLNASTVAAATRHWVKLFTSWADGQIDFSTNAYEETVFTHAAVLRPDKTFEIHALGSIRI